MNDNSFTARNFMSSISSESRAVEPELKF